MPTERHSDETKSAGAERTELEKLLRPVLDMAFRYAARLSGDREAAMDLVQDASVSAYRAFSQFESGTNFKAWFLRILTNRYFQTRRLESQFPLVALDDAPELYLYRQARRLGLPVDDPAAFVMAKLDGDAACEALNRLPDEYRVVATLHFLSDATYEECALTLDIPIGTVRSRLHRARRLLQFALWGIAQERGFIPKENTR